MSAFISLDADVMRVGSNVNLEAALGLASKGFAVFPCNANKTPKGKWREQSTTDEATIWAWWAQYPDAVPGLDCGKSSLLVIDLDRKTGAPDGVAYFAELLEQNAVAHDGGAPVGVVAVRTPSTGLHIYTRQPEGERLGNSPGLLKGHGVDVRGAGGYVLAPGATLPDGRRYAYEGAPRLGAGPLVVAPEWLLNLVRSKSPGKAKASAATPTHCASSSPVSLPVALAPFNEADRPWLMAAIADEAAHFAQLQSGGRNGILNEKAFGLGGYLREGFDREIMVTALLEAAKTCGYVTKHGLADTLATINRSITEGSQKRRDTKSERQPPIAFEGEAEGLAILQRKIQERDAAAAGAGLPISGGGFSPSAAPFPATLAAPAAPFPTFDASIFEGQPVPEREWLVPDFIPANAVTLFGGDGGTGKSLLALQLAVASVTGGDWLGMPVRPGQVLYLSAEDERGEFHRRLSHITKAQDFSYKHLKGLTVATLAGLDATLATFSREGMKTTPVFDELHKTLSCHRPMLLVLDNLADVFGGDEIKKHEVRAFMNRLSGLAIEFNMTVLLLAHPSQSGMTSGTGTSGNVAWNNSARSRLMLAASKNTDNVEIADIRELTVMKANYAAKGNKLIIRYEDGVFNKIEGAGNANSEMNMDNKFIELLKQYEKEGRDISPTLAPREFAAHPKGGSISKAGFKKAMDRLLENGLISIEVHGPPSHKRSKLVFETPELALG